MKIPPILMLAALGAIYVSAIYGEISVPTATPTSTNTPQLLHLPIVMNSFNATPTLIPSRTPTPCCTPKAPTLTPIP